MTKTAKTKKTVASPFLRWAGGKAKLIPLYLPYIPQDYDGYHEPFLGGGAMFWYLKPKKADLSDINAEVTNCYRVIRDDLLKFIDIVLYHQHRHSEGYFAKVRANYYVPHEELTNIQKAARFFYLNRTCFNGLYRENSKGLFTTPIGRTNKIGVDGKKEIKKMTINMELLKACSEFLYECSSFIVDEDFRSSLRRVTRGDFVFLDPPYHPKVEEKTENKSKSTGFNGYYQKPFSWQDRVDLKNEVLRLKSIGAKVMLCDADSPKTRELYECKGLRIIDIQANRSVGASAETRVKANELLVLNY